MKYLPTSSWHTPRHRAGEAGAPPAGLPEDTYIHLISMLLLAQRASWMMGFSFIAIAAAIWAETHDPLIGALGLAGTAASITRSLFLRRFRRRHPNGLATLEEARRWERGYLVLSVSFAGLVGLVGAATLTIGPPVTHLLATGLLFGYCSGVIARLAIRAGIALPCLLLASLPVVAAAALHPGFGYSIFAASLLLFLAGGVESTRFVTGTLAVQVRIQRDFALLARHDELTGLANRLALRTRFDAIAAGGSETLHRVAVHCLDLDRFKPVNDHYGHPIGDALLKAVGERLSRLLRAGDLAVRSGGDEFIILQADVEHVDQADMLARRIHRDIAAPYHLDGHRIEIGTSIGYALAPRDGTSLEQLVAAADARLYSVKRLGGGIAAAGTLPPEPDTRIAI